MEMIIQTLLNYVIFIPMIAMGFYLVRQIAIYRLRKSLQLTERTVISALDNQGKDKTALLVRYSGLFLGVLIGIYAIYQNTFIDRSITDLIIHYFAEFALLLIFMFTALRNADKVIFHKVSNDTEVFNGNLSVALVEASILVGTGLVVYGSLLGTGAIWSSIVFFIIGQLAFISLIWLYEVYESKFKNEELRDSIINGNLAKAIKLSSFIIVIALSIKAGIVGDYTGMIADLVWFASVFSIMMLSLFIYIWTIEKFVLNLVLIPNEVGSAVIKSVLRIGYIGITTYAVLTTL